ncbi:MULTISPECIES: hypothetical protein [Prauserella]|nr:MULTISPECIES: hypothetical protein [Prauserella]
MLVFEDIGYEVADATAIITVDRPERRNSFRAITAEKRPPRFAR